MDSVVVKVRVTVPSFVVDPDATAVPLEFAAVIATPGASSSFRVTVLLLWLVAVSFPTISYTLSSTGLTVRTSLPSGTPLMFRPRVYTFPLAEIALGVALPIVADPPLIESEKSPTSKAPDPEDVL